ARTPAAAVRTDIRSHWGVRASRAHQTHPPPVEGGETVDISQRHSSSTVVNTPRRNKGTKQATCVHTYPCKLLCLAVTTATAWRSLGHVHVCEPATAVAAKRVGKPRSSKLDGLHQPVLAILDDFHIRADTRYARPRLRKRAYQAQQSWPNEA